MSDSYNLPPAPEQDQSGAGDALPTYDDLAEQHGPNSRFGRWRGWIEKRAAERYNDITPAERERRRLRGWNVSDRTTASLFRPKDQNGPPYSMFSTNPSVSASSYGGPSNPPSIYASTHSSFIQIPPGPSPYASMLSVPSGYPSSMYSSAPSSYHMHPQLRLQTSFTDSIPASPFTHSKYPEPPASLIPESIPPSRLKLYNFGSRFLPHSTSPIRCLLPITNHHLLLIGHDDGLSVLDMFPRSDSPDDFDGDDKGPMDAEARVIWEGEGVHQMTILESESTGEGTPQGVVLVLVGTSVDSSKDQEEPRILRMYNLASLVSLAKWTVAQKGSVRPLDMRGASQSKNSYGLPKKIPRSTSSIAKGLKNLVLDNGSQLNTTSKHDSHVSHSSLSSIFTSPTKGKGKAPPPVSRTDSVDSDWDVVNELPLRWATNYTPLASTGSRLLNNAVLGYDIYRNEAQRGPGGVFLAIATKSSVLLYEAPKGERAFRFTKEFYTPLPPKSVMFVQQSVADNMSRSPSDIYPRATALDSHVARHQRVVSYSAAQLRTNYPTQLTLFVTFDKKAGTIRIADSAVGEIELYEDNWAAQQSALGAQSPSSASSAGGASVRHSRASWDGRAFAKEKAAWARPAHVLIPPSTARGRSTEMYLLTRGRQSHLVPFPLPSRLAALPPYRVLVWSAPPTHVAVRVCAPEADDPDAVDPNSMDAPFLQVVAFGEDGVEVQEIPLAQLSERKGKGRAQEPLRAQADTGGAAGLLLSGGHWDQPFIPGAGLSRSYSTSSYTTDESEEGYPRRPPQDGLYAWVQKGAEDWRVIWLGDGSADFDDGFEDFE
ncbi:uncharacterized protein BXZ73DRAFT_40085 [Epithele typhae]|uniref:uncharacterized protein n=1 Tax=Epithele typhae TaxID=378194 RepID=UPI002008CB49|nr:uncharacterized protein BXZ73DRAFT_40085 [Epithele typhae]KAH9943197.1 hypothetical protein BXZ73DRAFT_40085 [Epithele typhae]